LEARCTLCLSKILCLNPKQDDTAWESLLQALAQSAGSSSTPVSCSWWQPPPSSHKGKVLSEELARINDVVSEVRYGSIQCLDLPRLLPAADRKKRASDTCMGLQLACDTWKEEIMERNSDAP